MFCDFIAPPRQCIVNSPNRTFLFLLECICNNMSDMNADDKPGDATASPVAPANPVAPAPSAARPVRRASPAKSPAATKAAPPPASITNPVTKRARWAPAAPTSLSKLKLIGVIAGGAVLAISLIAGLHYMLDFQAAPAKVVLDDEFKDRVNEMADFAFRPPHKWHIDDRTQRYTYYVQGPRDNGFSPLMIFTSVSAPGTMADFVDEHKKRTVLEEPTVKFISTEDDVIDGCRAKRLEYDCDYKETDISPVVKLRTLQFIVKDPSFPVYYKITCHSTLESYPSHLPVFESSAHSFRRVEVKARIKYLPLEK